MSRIVLLGVLVGTLISPGVVRGVSQSTLWRSVLASGATDSRSNGTVLRATVGQRFIGRAQVNGLVLRAGFWPQPQGRATAVGDLPTARDAFRLHQNAPNPFNPATRIAFSLPEPASVELKVFDVHGRLVEILLQEPMGAGSHSLVYQPRDLASGIYFYRLRAGSQVQTQRMLLLK